MHGYRKTSVSAQRFAARRQQEDDAPRLSREVPHLVSLRLSIEERSTNFSVSTPRYLRHIMVGSAPALFLLPCGDPRCSEGGHDVTLQVMAALRSGSVSFKGQHLCGGAVGPIPCPRTVLYEGVAEYRAAS